MIAESKTIEIWDGLKIYFRKEDNEVCLEFQDDTMSPPRTVYYSMDSIDAKLLALRILDNVI